ncbi:MAG: metallophosphoesterase [Eubacteriales bacterium]|nr:metallophosphoesterase [Eubacteriales bacterium]
MRILVVSDTHGDFYSFKKAVEAQRSAEIIIHCGDSRDELDNIRMLYPNKAIIAVKGNCDFSSMLPSVEDRVIEGKKLFITHGHLYNAKMTLYPLCCAAREAKADIVLFGHTHNAIAEYDDGLYILNPGSLSGYNASYAYIDITEKGIMTNIVKLK